MASHSLQRIITILVLLHFIKAHGAAPSCATGDSLTGSLDDYGAVVDSVHAVVLWTIPDTAICHDSFPECSETYCAETYDFPEWADSLWSQTYPYSITRLFQDNSNGHHLVTASTPRGPNDQQFVIPMTYGGETWNSQYVKALLDSADRYVDFSIFDSDSSGTIDRLVICEASGASGAGIFHNNLLFSDTLQDSCWRNGMRVPCRITDYVVARFGTQGYWGPMELITHEYGHSIASGGQGISDLYGNPTGDPNNYGLGGFCCQADNGFKNPAGNDSRASVHNPLIRTGNYWTAPPMIPWIEETTISTTHLNFVLRDDLVSQSIYRVEDNLGHDSQYYLLTYHSRIGEWEKYYPSRALMIWHVDLSASQVDDRGGRKRLDIEHRGGMWDWTFSDIQDTVIQTYEEESCPPNITYPVRSTATNTMVANPVCGLDSFDVRYVSGYTGQATAPEYEHGQVGSLSMMYAEGDRFTPFTNPNSNFYADSQGTQSLVTGIEVQVVAIDSVNAIAHIIIDGWHGTMSHGALWSDSVSLTGNLTVESTASLTINPGTHVYVSPNASLTINGRIDIQGTSQNPVIFACSNPDSTWGGIRVLSADTNNVIKHVILRGVESVGVLAHHGYLRMEDCEIDGVNGAQLGTDYGAAFVYSDGYVLNSVIHGCERIGLFVVDNRVICNGNEIHDNGQGGVRFVRGDHVLAGNDLSSNGWELDSLRQPWAGVEIMGASVGIRCNNVSRNAGPGVFAFAGGFGSMSTRRWNHVHDNMGGAAEAGYDYGQIHMRGGHISLGAGYNSIYDDRDSQWLVRNALPDSVSLNMTHNYWGTIDSASIASRLPEFAGFQPYYSEVLACGSMPPDSGSNDVETVMFHSAWDMEHQGLFEAAASRYDSLINYYKSKKYSKPSLERLAFCKKADGLTWPEVRGYFFELAEDSSKDASLVAQCKISAAWCLANMEDFFGCAQELQALLDTAETETEIVSIQIDLLLNELKQNFTDGLFSTPGQRGLESDGLDAAERSDDMVAQKITRFANALDDIVAGRSGMNDHAQSEAPPLPSSFALHQNYPNPFNPSTEFSFDLPEGSIVELKVFDILGREVATVVDKYFEAGTHHISWDSRSTGATLASGVYVYQIKTGGFTDAKKMVLLR